MLNFSLHVHLAKETKQESRSRPWQAIQRVRPWQTTSRRWSRQAPKRAWPWQGQGPQSEGSPLGPATTAWAPAPVNHGTMGTTASATKAAALSFIRSLETRFLSIVSPGPSRTAESVPEWRQFHGDVSPANAGCEHCVPIWRFEPQWRCSV